MWKRTSLALAALILFAAPAAADGIINPGGPLSGSNTWTGTNIFTQPITVQGATVSFPNDSTILGFEAGSLKRNSSTSANEVLIGYQAGRLVPDALTYHTFIGFQAGAVVAAGAGGVIIGQKAGTLATTVQSSVAIGGKASSTWTNTTSDTVVGYGAAQFSNATSTGGRTYIGYAAGDRDNGDYNVMIGYAAGQHASQSNATAARNIGIGALTLTALSSGTDNIAMGYQALQAANSGTGNFALGYQSLFNVTTGSSNIAIGYAAGFGKTTISRNILLGTVVGNNLPDGSQNFFIAGSDSSGGSDRIDVVHFGKGYATASPTAYTLSGTHGFGTDIAGGGVIIGGGRGTGTGVGGDVQFSIAPAGSSSSNLNALTQIARFSGTNGHLLWNTDNTYDIGASGATRARTIYAGTSVIAPLFTGVLNSTNTFNAGATTSTGYFIVQINGVNYKVNACLASGC